MVEATEQLTIQLSSTDPAVLLSVADRFNLNVHDDDGEFRTFCDTCTLDF